MDLLVSIITNAAFIAIATLVLNNLFNIKLQKQKGKIDKELEIAKSEQKLYLSNEEVKMNQKRDVYIHLIQRMAVFIGERVPSEQILVYKQEFLKIYDVSWLWASDEVMKAISIYMQYKIDNNEKVGTTLSKDELNRLNGQEKELFANCVLAMRKDIGFTNTVLNSNDYKFINF